MEMCSVWGSCEQLEGMVGAEAQCLRGAVRHAGCFVACLLGAAQGHCVHAVWSVGHQAATEAVEAMPRSTA